MGLNPNAAEVIHTQRPPNQWDCILLRMFQSMQLWKATLQDGHLPPTIQSFRRGRITKDDILVPAFADDRNAVRERLPLCIRGSGVEIPVPGSTPAN
jgi:hypothetical protein